MVFAVNAINALKTRLTVTIKKPVYDNHLKQQFEVERPNTAWSCDITYVLTDEGWLYVAGVKDLHTKELVGYCLSSRMTADIVVQALNMAIKRRKPTKGLIVHSDRGSQYCSHAYRDLITQHQFVGSMSAKGNCYDNAPIESFWATLKNELVYHQHYVTRAEAIKDIQHFIEIFYNRMRIQAKLNFRSPAQVFEALKWLPDLSQIHSYGKLNTHHEIDWILKSPERKNILRSLDPQLLALFHESNSPYAKKNTPQKASSASSTKKSRPLIQQAPKYDIAELAKRTTHTQEEMLWVLNSSKRRGILKELAPELIATFKTLCNDK
jgi:hypothetical protein